MDKEKNEKHLDELIYRAINTEKPQFDAEKWKQKYPDEYHTLLSRAAKGDSTRQPGILKVILKSPLTKLAAAAVIILAVSFFIAPQGPDEQADTTTVSKATKSPVEMMTALSLERAFRRGGIKAVENQCEQALKLLGSRTASLSSKELLSEFNGS